LEGASAERASERVAEITAHLEAMRSDLTQRREAEEAILEARRDSEVAQARDAQRSTREELDAVVNQAAPRDFDFLGQTVVKFDQMVNADVLRRLDELAGDRLQSVQLNFEADRDNLRARSNAELDQARRAVDSEIADVNSRAALDVQKKREA